MSGINWNVQTGRNSDDFISGITEIWETEGILMWKSSKLQDSNASVTNISADSW